MRPIVLQTVACLAVPALGEIVRLNDGTSIEGDLHKTADGWVVTKADGHSVTIPADQVKSIGLSKPAAETPDMAARNLASLRRAVATQADPKQVVDRYKAFIAQNAGTPVAQEAAQDMAAWQDRVDHGLVRAGDQWVTREQLAELQEKALSAATQVQALARGGKLVEAAAMLDKALAVAPANPSLLYLHGVLLFKQQQIAPARKAFEGVETQVPESGATENNLAVILWRQHAEMPALLHYDKAMLAEPVDQTILDNVAEALHALPEPHRKNPLTKKVVDHFNDQDASLQKKMAEKGLYRSGSGWITEKEYNKQQAEEKAVQEKIEALKKQFADVQERMITIERDIRNEQEICNAILSESTQTDGQGHVIQYPPPQRYYDLQRDIKSLQTERVMKQRQLALMPKQAADLEKTRPPKKYTGVQKIMDVDAMPGASPGVAAAAASLPTTRPSSAAAAH